MPTNKVIAAFYLASGIILYVAYATLIPSYKIGAAPGEAF